jgi:hypothetical protein
VTWSEDWPIVGVNPDENGCGEPVNQMTKPDWEVKINSKYSPYFPYFGECDIYEMKNDSSVDEYGLSASDTFPAGRYGIQWQWLGDHSDSFFGAVVDESGKEEDGLRLFCQNPSGDEQPTIWRSANVLTQKLVYPVFEAKAELDATGLKDGDRAGVVMTGGQYVTAFIERRDDDYFICVANSQGPDDKKDENRISSFSIATIDSIRDMNQIVGELYFRLRFTYENRSFDSQQLYFQDVNSPMFGENPCLTIELGIKDANGNIQYKDLGVNFTPSDHTWVGAKLGIYALGSGRPNTGFSEAGKDCSDHSNAQCGYVDLRSIEVREL